MKKTLEKAAHAGSSKRHNVGKMSFQHSLNTLVDNSLVIIQYSEVRTMYHSKNGVMKGILKVPLTTTGLQH